MWQLEIFLWRQRKTTKEMHFEFRFCSGRERREDEQRKWDAGLIWLIHHLLSWKDCCKCWNLTILVIKTVIPICVWWFLMIRNRRVWGAVSTQPTHLLQILVSDAIPRTGIWETFTVRALPETTFCLLSYFPLSDRQKQRSNLVNFTPKITST